MNETNRPSLAGIEQRAAAATEGSWVAADCTDEESDWYDDYDGPMIVTQDSTPGVYTAICKDFWEEGAGPANARFVADARTAVPALTAAVRDVLALHKPFEWSFGQGSVRSCRECTRLGASEEDVLYPCPTVRALVPHLDLTDLEGDPT